MSGLHMTERLLTKGMRYLLLIAGALVFLAGLQLFVLTEHTDRYFAWTIDSFMTAAFLGAGYWASVALEWVAARQRTWAQARVAVPPVFVFTTLTLVATVLHRDLFHFGDPSALTSTLTWAWLAIYAFVPPVMLVLWLRQVTAAGGDSGGGVPVPRWMELVLGTQAVVLGVVGLLLFVLPDDTASIWPWVLTPLTARAVAAWLLGIAVAAANVAWDGDAEHARPALVAWLVLGVLQVIALLRYSAEVDWASASAWVYLIFVASILLVGGAGVLRATGRLRRL